MKRLRKLLGVAAAGTAIAMLSSCMTLDMIARAEGTTPPDDPYGRPYEPEPVYYALVPLTAPLDLITLPVQYFYFQSDRERTAPPPRGDVPPPPPSSGGYSYDDPRAAQF